MKNLNIQTNIIIKSFCGDDVADEMSDALRPRLNDIGVQVSFFSQVDDGDEKYVATMKMYSSGAGECVCYDENWYKEISDIFYQISGEKRPNNNDKEPWKYILYCHQEDPTRLRRLKKFLADNDIYVGGDFLKCFRSYTDFLPMGELGCKNGECATSIKYGVEYKGAVEEIGEMVLAENNQGYVVCLNPDLFYLMEADFRTVFGKDEPLPQFDDETVIIRSDSGSYERMQDLKSRIPFKSFDEVIRKIRRPQSQKDKRYE